MNTVASRSLVVSMMVGASLVFFSGASFAEAQENAKSFTDGLRQVKTLSETNKLGEAKSTKEILQSIVKWLLSLVGTIAVISLLYAGYLYVSSQGDDNQTERAKTLILYSVIGLIIIGLSAIIVNVVISLTQ